MESPPSRVPALIAVGLTLAMFVAVLLLFFLATSGGQPVPRESFADSAEEKMTLRFGKIPYVSPREAYRLFSGLTLLLEEHLDCCHVELVLAPDYASCVRMLEEEQVDIAWLGTATYVANRGRVPMVPLVSPIWSGRRGYTGVIFAVESSQIQRLDQLRGKRFAFVDPESASGYLYPRRLLAEAGIIPERDFSHMEFLGSHDAVVMAVLLGEYDAGAVYERAYLTVADRSRRLTLRILAQTPPIPGEPIVAGVHVSPAIAAEVREAFLSIPPEALARGALNDLFGFNPVSEAHYDDVHVSEGP